MAGTRATADCGDLDLRIGADGTWFYRGSRIERMALVKLFASVLRRDADGSYWLITPVERGRVEVDDAPFLIVEMDMEGAGEQRRIRMRTNLDRWIEVGDQHPLRVAASPTGEPRLYVGLDHGLAAALARPVWYELLEHALTEGAERAQDVGIWAGGVRFDLSALAGTDA